MSQLPSRISDDLPFIHDFNVIFTPPFHANWAPPKDDVYVMLEAGMKNPMASVHASTYSVRVVAIVANRVPKCGASFELHNSSW